MPLKSVGIIANRPTPPNVGDEYTATDTVTSYKCYTAGTWTADATGSVAGSGTGNTIALWTGVGPSTTLGDSVLTVTGTNATLTYTPTASTSGSPTILTIIGPAHTTLAAAEAIDINFNLARTVQFTTGGTIAVQRAALFRAPTYSATAATQTLTDAATTTITGAPVAGANVAITRPWSFWIQGGSVRYDGDVVHNAANADFRAAIGDANPVIRVSPTTGLLLGAGGASALDTLIARSAASIVTINNNAGGGSLNFGAITGSLYYESATGAAAAVSGAATGRIRYNNTSGRWQVSTQAGAYVDLLTGAAGSFGWLQGGNSFGVAGDLGTNDGFAVNIRTTGVTRWVLPTGSFDFIQQGAGTLRNTADNALTIGTATQRVVSISAIQHNVFTASGDANASAQLSTGAVVLGVGGATALDSRIRRTAAATLTIDNNSTGAATVVPAADNQNVLGTAPLRWATINCVTINHVNAASDANPTIQVNTTGVRYGAGGASALDTRLARTSASTLTIDNNAGGGAFNLSAVTGALFFESSDGAAAAVSGAATGRIRYNNTTGTFQASMQTGAYTSFTLGSGTANTIPKWTGATTLGNSVLVADASNNSLTYTPVATAGATSPTILTITGPAHTAVVVSEVDDVVFNLARTVQFTTGATLAVQRSVIFQPPTFTATAATQNITDASTVAISGPPVASTNVNIARPYTLWIQSGIVRYDGDTHHIATTNNYFLVLGDANPATRLSTAGLHFGPGGAGALDVLMARTGTSLLSFNNAAGGGSINLGLVTGSLFYESANGAGAGLSGAATGRIVYNNTTGTFQISTQGGAYKDIATIPAGGAVWLQNGNSFGTTGTIGTNDANQIDVRTSGVTRFSILAAANTISGNAGLTIQGGSTASNILTFSSTSNATKGTIDFGTFARFDEVNTRFLFGTQTPIGTERFRVTGGASIFDFTGSPAVSIRTTAGTFDMWQFDTVNTKMTITNDVNVATFAGVYNHTSISGGANLQFLDLYDNANVPTYVTRRARGTAAAPSAVLSGDQLGSYSGRGYGATGFSTGSRGRYIWQTSENWTDTAQGCEWYLAVTPTGTTTLTTALSVRNNGDMRMEGNHNWIPTTDSFGNIGTATLRFSDVVANTHRVFAAASDANASAQLSTGAIILGVGGATALDTRMRRTAAATLTLDNNSTGAVTVVPATDNQNVLGTAPLRWATLNIVTANAILAASDANPSVRMDNAGFYLGAGGASALDCRIRRTAATTITIDNNSTGGVDIVPATTNTGHFGTDALKWNRVRATTVVTGDLEMQDEERNAHWVLREETDRIVAYNKITGKKYEMSMKEIK